VCDWVDHSIFSAASLLRWAFIEGGSFMMFFDILDKNVGRRVFEEVPPWFV
jgi:hypothetical protein